MREYLSLKNKRISFLKIKTLQLFGIGIVLNLMIILSFGLLAPVTIVIWERFICERRYINGRKLKFNGKIKDLYLKYIVWYILSILTLGIYSFWAYIKYYKWKISNTVFADQTNNVQTSEFVGNVKEFIILNIIIFFIGILTLGIGIPWVICIRSKWLTTHTYICGEHLEYVGKGSDLFGYFFIWLFYTIITLGFYNIWFFKHLLEWDSVNQKINNVSRVESIQDIIKYMLKYEKVIFAPFFISLIIVVFFSIGLNKYLDTPIIDNRDFIIEDGILIKYRGNKSEIVIPEEVFIIGTEAFLGNNTITKVIISGNVVRIEESAFKGCMNLKTVKIENGLIDIQSKAFYDCYRLISVFIPNSVSTIYADSFSGSLNLTIYTPNESKPYFWDGKILNNANIIWSISNVDENFMYAYELNDTVTILKYIGNEYEVIIPSEIDGITVTKIAESAFEGNHNIKEIIIPDTVVEIGKSAFANCNKLESIILSKNITRIEESIFIDCFNLKEVIIPQGVVVIDRLAFYNCYDLTNIVIPDSVRIIGESAFYYCTSLDNVVVPDSVEDIGEGVFLYNVNLKTIKFSKNIKIIPKLIFAGCYSLTSFVISDRVEEINTYAFIDCTNLTEVYIPNNVSTIQKYAFWYSPDLTIYTEFENKPSTWSNDWTQDESKVIWGADMPL